MLLHANHERTAVAFRNEFCEFWQNWFDQKLVLEKRRLPGAVIPDPNVQVDREDPPFRITRGSSKLAHSLANFNVAFFHKALDCANQRNHGIVTLGSP